MTLAEASTEDLIGELEDRGVLTPEYDHEGVTALQTAESLKPRYVIGRPLKRYVTTWRVIDE